jgi:hypothetical protein
MLAPINGTVSKFPVYQHYGRPWSEIRERRDARDEAKRVTSLLSDALPPRLPKSRFTCRGAINQERAYETYGITFCFVKESAVQRTICNFNFNFLSSMFPPATSDRLWRAEARYQSPPATELPTLKYPKEGEREGPATGARAQASCASLNSVCLRGSALTLHIMGRSVCEWLCVAVSFSPKVKRGPVYGSLRCRVPGKDDRATLSLFSPDTSLRSRIYLSWCSDWDCSVPLVISSFHHFPFYSRLAATRPPPS